MRTEYVAHSKQIADALEPIRTQAMASLKQVLNDAGRDVSRLNPGSHGDFLTRAHQMLSMVEMFAQHPTYVPRSEFQATSGYILLALNGHNQPKVDDAGKMLLNLFPDVADRARFLASVFYGVKADQNEIQPMVRIMAAILMLMGLSTQQVVAMSFNDSASVNELQQEKLKVQAALMSGG